MYKNIAYCKGTHPPTAANQQRYGGIFSTGKISAPKDAMWCTARLQLLHACHDGTPGTTLADALATTERV